MSELFINDFLDVLREENTKLLSDLNFERNLNQILDNIRNYSLVLINSCKCGQKSNVLRKFKRFNSIYDDLKANRILRQLSSTVASIADSEETSESDVRTLSSDAVTSVEPIGEVFASETDLDVELNREDNSGQPFNCGECQTLFFTSEVFIRHLQRKHNKYVLKCNSCDYKSCNKSLLTKHKSNHKSPEKAVNMSKRDLTPNKALNVTPNRSTITTPSKRRSVDISVQSVPKKARKSINDSSPKKSVPELTPKRRNPVRTPKKTTPELSAKETGPQLQPKKTTPKSTPKKVSPVLSGRTTTPKSMTKTTTTELIISKTTPPESTSKPKTPESTSELIVAKTTTPELRANNRLIKLFDLKSAAKVKTNLNLRFITELIDESHREVNEANEELSEDTENLGQNSDQIEPKVKRQTADANEFVCNECNHLFPTEIKLLNHLSYKHKVLSFECDLCDYKTSKLFYLERHKTIHSSEKPFICDINDCRKRFKTKGILLTHKRQSHSGVKRFVCDLCDYKTTNKNSLMNHKSRHSEDKPFKCDVNGCDKQFKTTICLYQHKSVVHSTDQFICQWPQCNRLYNCKKALTQHQLIHTIEKPLVCGLNGCVKEFKEKRSLKRHQQNNCVMNKLDFK